MQLRWRQRLVARGFVDGARGLAWTGEPGCPGGLPFVRPTTTGTWRVRIEEWETLPGDRLDLGDPHSPPTREQRLVYADEFELGDESTP